MNYIQHPNLLVQFWASVNTEFDRILDRFVKCDGWLFQDMAVIVKKANVGSIYRCVTTLVNSPQHGKEERMQHFHRVNYAILDAAKIQWLVPWRKYVVDPSKGVLPPFLKRQVGGFFLLYMLYSNQPLPNRFHRKQRILMDSRDLIAMHVFNCTMQRLPKSDDQFKELARQLVVMFNDLVSSEAFEFCSFNDTFTTPKASIRNLLAAKFCSFTNNIYSLKDIRDQLHYITYQESPSVFHSFVKYGRQMSKTIDANVKNSNSEGDDKKTDDKTEDFHHSKSWTVEEIKALENENDLGKIAHNIPSILKSLDFGPILTRNRLLGVSNVYLDREVNHCAHVYDEQMKREKNIIQKRRCKRKQPQVDSTSTVWKAYLNGNFDWVDNVLQTGGNSSLNSPPAPPADSNEEVGDEEWETDTDDEDDDVIICNDLSCETCGVDDIILKEGNPKKKHANNLSMPTID